MIRKITPLYTSKTASFTGKNKSNPNTLNYKINFGNDTDIFKPTILREVYDKSIHLKDKHIDSFRFNEDFVLENSSAKKLYALKEGSIINSQIDEITGNSELSIINAKLQKALVQGKIFAISTNPKEPINFILMKSRTSNIYLDGGIGNYLQAGKKAYIKNSSINNIEAGNIYVDKNTHVDKIISSGSVFLAGHSTSNRINIIKSNDEADKKNSVFLTKVPQNMIIIFPKSNEGNVFMPQSLELENPPKVKNGDIVYVPDELFDDILNKTKEKFERTSN